MLSCCSCLLYGRVYVCVSVLALKQLLQEASIRLKKRIRHQANNQTANCKCAAKKSCLCFQLHQVFSLNISISMPEKNFLCFTQVKIILVMSLAKRCKLLLMQNTIHIKIKREMVKNETLCKIFAWNRILLPHKDTEFWASFWSDDLKWELSYYIVT